MNTKRLLATIAMTAGVAIGLASTANAADDEADFLQCVVGHQDTDGIGVCCVFYGGTYNERTGECWGRPRLGRRRGIESRPQGPSPTRTNTGGTSRHYYVGEPWFVQVLEGGAEVARVELDDPGGINPALRR